MSDIRVNAADGSRTRTVSTTSGNGMLLSRMVAQRNADGVTGTTATDSNGDGANDLVIGVAWDASNRLVETSTAFSANGVMLSRSAKITSVDGLSVAVQSDVTGDGVNDRLTGSVRVVNADRSQVVTAETRSGNSTLQSRSVTSISADRHR